MLNNFWLNEWKFWLCKWLCNVLVNLWLMYNTSTHLVRETFFIFFCIIFGEWNNSCIFYCVNFMLWEQIIFHLSRSWGQPFSQHWTVISPECVFTHKAAMVISINNHKYFFNFTVQSLYTWVKDFRINPELRILRLTFHRKSASKFWIWEIILASLISFHII